MSTVTTTTMATLTLTASTATGMTEEADAGDFTPPVARSATGGEARAQRGRGGHEHLARDAHDLPAACGGTGGVKEPPTLLRLLAWMSPAFPTGAFSFSHGLETAVEDGRVKRVEDLVGYATTAITRGAGQLDAAFLVLAYRAVIARDDAALIDVAERAAAMRGSAELALESRVQGQAFLTTVRAAWPSPDIDAPAAVLRSAGIEIAHPIAVALAAAAARLPLDATLEAFLHGFAANLVSAGVRVIPLGQTDGQRALAALEPVVARAAALALDVADVDDLGASAPLIDLLSIRHETQYTRLFRS
jgi:urease accessory protein